MRSTPPRAIAPQHRVFGHQLLIDCYDCREGVCDDLSLGYRFLEAMVDRLGMEKQSPPSIFRSDDKRFPDKAGLSGWVPLIESSIVIHTLSVKSFISIDVYCCREFDISSALALCQKFFEPAAIEHHCVERGRQYYVRPQPRDVPEINSPSLR